MTDISAEPRHRRIGVREPRDPHHDPHRCPDMSADAAADTATDAASAYIPVIDLTPTRSGVPADRVAVANEIDRACRESGFLVVTGHDVDPDLVQRLHDVTLELFSQPDEWKQQWDC